MRQAGQSTRNLEIDRLRAIAILITMYAHLDYIMLGDSEYYTASKAFFNPISGVILFFAISGYVISKSLIPSMDSGMNWTQPLIQFWIKRSTRILPMAVLWIVVPLALSYSFNSRSIFHNFENNLTAAPYAILFVFNIFATLAENKSMFGVYWSLSLEEQFYIFFPVFLIIFSGYFKRVVSLLFIAVGLAFIPPEFTVLRLDAILYGVLLFLLLKQQEWGSRVSKAQGVVTTVLGAIALATCSPFLQYLDFPSWLAPIFTALLSVCILHLAVQQRNYVPSLGSQFDSVIDWIGTRSFGLYLIHIPSYMLAGEITWRMQMFDTILGRFTISIVLMLVTTEFCYRYFETPIRSWGKKIASSGDK